MSSCDGDNNGADDDRETVLLNAWFNVVQNPPNLLNLETNGTISLKHLDQQGL